MKKFTFVLSLALACSMLLTACGSSSGADTSKVEGDKSSASTVETGAENYTFRTGTENRVVTENGTFTRENVTGPILLTSIGQSADVSVLDALMRKIGAEYTYNPTAPAEDVANHRTVILCCGASSKGLGAAGISQDDEMARAQKIVETCAEKDITVIIAHLGGTSRRGTLSDMLTDLALPCADYILMVEEGNMKDGKFTDAAQEMGIPITLINAIADAAGTLTELFGA